MKKSEVEPGELYVAKVSGELCTVRLGRPLRGRQGWEAVNLETGRAIIIRSAQRLRGLVRDEA